MIAKTDIPLEFPASKFLSICGLITLAFIYAKLTVHLYVKWTYILSPMILFFGLNFVKCIYNFSRRMPRQKVLWNLCQLLITAPLAVATFYLGILIDQIMEKENDEIINEALTHLFACVAFTLLVYLIYSIKSSKQNTENGVIMNFILSIFGNTVNVCSGGACNSFYMSTISAFFSAFGIQIAQYIHYLNYLCIILLAFSLLSLYSVKNSIKYAPFIGTLIGAMLILTDMFIIDFNYANYGGNILVIGCAFWNSSLNKFRFGKE